MDRVLFTNVSRNAQYKDVNKKTSENQQHNYIFKVKVYNVHSRLALSTV